MTSRGERPTTRWLAMHGTARGSLHVRRQQPCEDAAGVLTAGAWTAVSVADGHGNARYPRAARGAELAVKVATRVMVDLPDADLDEVTEALDRLPRRLCSEWQARVQADVERAPLTDDELRLMGGPEHNDPRQAHGTTILGAAASARWLALLQLGDGDIVVGHASGAPAGRSLRPAPQADPRVTDSLSQPDAASRTLVALVDLGDAPVEVVLLSTDGFGAAFAQPDWHDETARQLVEASQAMDDTALASAIRNWCGPPAAVGGDDVALGLLVARDGAGGEPPTRRKGHR